MKSLSRTTARVIGLVLSLLLWPGAGRVLAAPAVPPNLYAGMRWRLVGPFRGGRVLAVTGVASEPDTWYLGAVVGGVWKTTNGGNTWRPIFDHEPVASIGAIAVAPSNPNVIYVGTGESAPRGDISFGDGVYKSTDAGRTWTDVGLRDSRHIAQIIVDPHNPDIVLVAALGDIYGPNTERGVFRSTDGGRTWQKVLYKDEQTGAVDLAFDPSNPSIVYGALWQVSRTPWSFSSGGPGSGLYRSTDEGRTWTRLEGHGLPHGILGKIGVSVAGGSRGRRVYALIEADHGGLFRSDDAGRTWRRVNGGQELRTRAWYFTRVWASPVNPDVVYVADNAFWKSTDGGRTFEPVPIPGGDNHGFWMNPSAPDRMIESNDQGVVISVDGGRSWLKLDNLPIGQFYHVSTDDRFPYYLYGAQQDMGAIAIASRGWGGITRSDWYSVGGDDGESGYVLPEPGDPNLVIAGGYGGALTRFDVRTKQLNDIAPWSNNNGGHAASEVKYRFTWTAPLAFSPQDPHVLYMGSQYLMKTTNGGMSWAVISPDLSRDDKSKQGLSGGPITKDNSSAEYYDLIYSIAPSKVSAGEIWVGSDDGLVHLTRDGGRTWQNVTPQGLPAWAKVSTIEASPYDAGTAYLAVDAHKLDDLHPYIFRTHDYGRTWVKITDGISAPAYVHAVREDPVRRGLLFAGTETGAYVSFDDGDHWQSLQLNLPTASVRDLAVHGDDLAIATHGRSFWILDDITPLRQATAAVAGEPVHLFEPATALRTHEAGTYTISSGGIGKNPPDGAVLDYYLQSEPAGEVSLEVVDSHGVVAFRASSAPLTETAAGVASMPGESQTGVRLSRKPGMHRVVWNLRYALPVPIPGAAYDERPPRGILGLPGTYQVRLTVAGRTYTQPLTVTNDPRVKISQADLVSQFQLATTLMDAVRRDHVAVNQILDVRAQLAALQRRLAEDPQAGALGAAAAAALDRKAAVIENVLYQSRAKTGEELLNYPTELNSKIAYLEDEVDFGDTAPTAQFREMATEYEQHLQEQLTRWETLKAQDLKALNDRLHARGIDAIFPAPGPR